MLKRKMEGFGDARNYGIPYATSDYIAFLDSDDYVEKQLYETLYEVAQKENSDLVECDFYWAYPNKKRQDIGTFYKGKQQMLVEARVVAWNKLIRKELIEKNNILFPKRLRYEDVEFFYQLIPYIEKVSFVKKPMIYYVQRENSISNSQNERTKEIFTVLDHVIAYYKRKGFYEEYKEELEFIYTRYSLCSSLKRMTHIKNKKVRKGLLQFTWQNLNDQFPNWKKNKYLKRKGKKNHYMKTVNCFTYSIYCFLFSFI